MCNVFPVYCQGRLFAYNTDTKCDTNISWHDPSFRKCALD